MGVSVHPKNSYILKVLYRDVAHYSRREARGESHGSFRSKFYIIAKRMMVVVCQFSDSY